MQIEKAKQQMSPCILGVVYVALIVLYCGLYAPYGLENNDSGFILGYSYQFSQGLTLYKDLLYVRPPVSIILHSLYFMHPFDSAPVLFSRLVFFILVGAYSALSALIFSRLFNFKNYQLLLISCVSFLINVNNFPPMAWHTVDGIFFSVLAVFFSLQANAKNFIGNAFLAFFFASIAALSKQPFYISPLIVSILLVLGASRREIIFTTFSFLLANALILVLLSSILKIDDMILAITAQTSTRDLLLAGIFDYIRDWFNVRHLFAALPISLVLIYWAFYRFKNYNGEINRNEKILVATSVFIFLASLLFEFYTSKSRTTIGSYVDVVFTVAAFICIYKAIKIRSSSWYGLTALHAISWASSISWGGMSVFLFSSPVVCVIALMLRDVFRNCKYNNYLAVSIVIYMIFLFKIGNSYLYSLEGQVKMVDNTIYMGEEFPALRGIYTTKEEYLAFHELQNLTKNIDGKFIVAPNWPLCTIVFSNCEKTGTTWLLNAEVNSFEEKIKEKISRLDYIFVFKNAKPSPELNGKFGSKITGWIIENWHPVHINSNYFNVYSNPRTQNNETKVGA